MTDSTALGSRPVPDPTELTSRAVKEVSEQLHEYIDGRIEQLETRLDGDEKAGLLRLKSIDAVPTLIHDKVEHLKELDALRTSYEREISDIRFQGQAALQASADDLRATALIAAFAAQKESAAVAQTTTTAALGALGVLVQTSINGLNDKVDDLKDRVGKVESVKVGAFEQRVESRQNNTALYAAVGFGITVILFLLAVIGFVITQSAP